MLSIFCGLVLANAYKRLMEDCDKPNYFLGLGLSSKKVQLLAQMESVLPIVGSGRGKHVQSTQ